MRLPFHPVQIDDFACSFEPSAPPGCLPHPFLLSHPNLLPLQGHRKGAGQPQNQSARTIVFFLSHFHTDHMQGITAAWDGGYIYTTHTTRELLRQRFGDAFVDGVPSAAIEAYIRRLSTLSNANNRSVQQSSVGPLHTIDFIRLRRAAQSGALARGMAGVTCGGIGEGAVLGMSSADLLGLSSAPPPPRMLFDDRAVPPLTPRVVPVEFEVKAWVSLSRGGPVHVGSSPPQQPLSSTLFANRFHSHCCDYLQFTFIPAHHIAGSAMIMFPQTRIGTCLYTGDFRYDPHTDEGRMMIESIRFWARRESEEGEREEREEAGENTRREDDGVENDKEQSLTFCRLPWSASSSCGGLQSGDEQKGASKGRALENSEVVVHDVCGGDGGPDSEFQVVASNRQKVCVNSLALTSVVENEPPSGNNSKSDTVCDEHRGHGGSYGNKDLAFSKESMGKKDDGEHTLLGEDERVQEQEEEEKECEEKNEAQDEWLLEALLASSEDRGSDGDGEEITVRTEEGMLWPLHKNCSIHVTPSGNEGNRKQGTNATATPSLQEEQRSGELEDARHEHCSPDATELTTTTGTNEKGNASSSSHQHQRCVQPLRPAQQTVIDHLFLDDTWLHLTLSNNFSSSFRNNNEKGKRAEGAITGGSESFDRVRSKLLSAAELVKAFRAVAKAVISNLAQDLSSARLLGVPNELGEGGLSNRHDYYYYEHNKDISSHSFVSRIKGGKGGSFVDVYRNRPFITRCYIRNNFGKEHLLMTFAKVLGTTVVVDDERYELARACCDPNSPDAEVDPAASQLDLRYFTPASRWEETVRTYFLLKKTGGEGGAKEKEAADGFLVSLPFPPCCIEVVSQIGMISQTSLAKASRVEEEMDWTRPPNARGENACMSASVLRVRAYGVIMSGWAKLRGRAARGSAEIFDIPYSLHTSPEHLVQFVASLRPRSVNQLQHGKGRGVGRESAMMTRLGRHLATPFINAPILPAEERYMMDGSGRSVNEGIFRTRRRTDGDGHPSQLSARSRVTAGEGGIGGKGGAVPCTLTPPAWVLARASVSNFPRGPAVRLRIPTTRKKYSTLTRAAERETDSDETDDGGARLDLISINKRGDQDTEQPHEHGEVDPRPRLSGLKRGHREVHTVLDDDDDRGGDEESGQCEQESKRIIELFDEIEEILGE